ETIESSVTLPQVEDSEFQCRMVRLGRQACEHGPPSSPLRRRAPSLTPPATNRTPRLLAVGRPARVSSPATPEVRLSLRDSSTSSAAPTTVASPSPCREPCRRDLGSA